MTKNNGTLLDGTHLDIIEERNLRENVVTRTHLDIIEERNLRENVVTMASAKVKDGLEESFSAPSSLAGGTQAL
ncbi:hypothetical protein TIFTF001_033972 [Ficus carica]|uniref:Uncharacterized protein n=1 Tax=Ficus carica TaxID=3494 RepID=A0AA88DZP6_FICCA|nr:hypothetical protein TIFTF001_033972 [Ficus carica]